MYYEGGFENNKPSGDGKWIFKNGNILSGEFNQSEVTLEEEDIAALKEKLGLTDDQEPPKQYKINWNSQTKIAENAHLINSTER